MTRPLSSRPGRRRRSIPKTSFCCGRLTAELLVPTVAAGVPLLAPSRCPTANEEPGKAAHEVWFADVAGLLHHLGVDAQVDLRQNDAIEVFAEELAENVI